MYILNTVKLFFAEIIISVLFTEIIQRLEILNTTHGSFAAVLIIFVLISVLYFFNCRHTSFNACMFYGDFGGKKYLRLALCPLAVITLTAAVLSYFNVEPIYTYLFLPFKLFAILDVYKPLSALLCGILLIIPAIIVYFIRPEPEAENDN